MNGDLYLVRTPFGSKINLFFSGNPKCITSKKTTIN